MRGGERAVGLRAHEPVALEPAQRLADDRRLDVEVARQPVLVQYRSTRELTADDAALDLVPRALTRLVPHATEST